MVLLAMSLCDCDLGARVYNKSILNREILCFQQFTSSGARNNNYVTPQQLVNCCFCCLFNRLCKILHYSTIMSVSNLCSQLNKQTVIQFIAKICNFLTRTVLYSNCSHSINFVCLNLTLLNVVNVVFTRKASPLVF